MRITILSCLASLAALCGLLTAAPVDAEPSIEPQLAKFREVAMPMPAGFSKRERRMVDKLVEATRLLDEVFWQQTDPEGLTLYRSLVDHPAPEQQRLRRYLRINGGRYDLIAEFAPFAGAGPRPPGGSQYPADLTRAEFDAYVAAHPQEKAGLYDPFTVVRRQDTALRAVPYRVEYRRWLEPMAKALKEAAALSDDPAFAKFLHLRAAALLSDDYFASDLAWLDLKNPKFDLIFAPYETYLDHFLGVKTSFGSAILIRNEPESRKLAVFQTYVPDIQDALPLQPEDRPSKHGHASPMEVMDSPYRGGDLRHGYQVVADNLPNDPRVHEQKGSKKIFFKNFMDARVNNVILPIAARLLRSDQVKLATAQGYLTGTIMHEIAHGLGPAFARTTGGRQDIRASIGPQFSGLEEAKADITGLFGLAWLADHGRYPKAQMAEIYVSHIAGIFRTVRFGVEEAHGRAEIMEFNFLSEREAIGYDATTQRYSLDVNAMPPAVAALARELLEQEASGDRGRTESWFARYGVMPPQLQKVLDAVQDVPVDVDPIFDFRDL